MQNDKSLIPVKKWYKESERRAEAAKYNTPGPYTQHWIWSCGPAALRILLAMHNHNVSEEQLIQLTGANPSTGTTHEGLIDAAEALGYTVFASENCTDQDVLSSVDSGSPVIVDFKGFRDGHYVVVTGATDGYVKIVDPRYRGDQEHSIPWDTFEARWQSKGTTVYKKQRPPTWAMGIIPK